MEHKDQGGVITVRSGFDPQQRVVRIEITDQGKGIPADIRDRVFEPFFTTKAKGSGTGLGLAVSRRLIEEHSGKLSFESQPKYIFLAALRCLLDFPG